MNKDLLERINKAFNTKLVEEDISKPGFSFFIGKYQKSKPDKTGCRLSIDTIIEIKGFSRFSIGIRSYVLNNPKCDCCFGYLGYWIEKSYKKYNVSEYQVDNLEQAFNEVIKHQKITLPCVSITLNGVKYIQFIMDNVRNKVYLYRPDNKKVEVVSKDLFQKALHTTGSDIVTRDECEQIYETVHVYKNGIPFTTIELLYGYYLSEFYHKILLEHKKRIGNVDITKWAKA